MLLSDAQITEFQQLYKEHFGVELTKAQALEKGLRLIRLIEIMSRAIAHEQNQPQGNT